MGSSAQTPPATEKDLTARGSVHLPRSQHIQDEDSDERIIAKLRSHGVYLGKGMISPRVF